jgi:hypothetical protein
VSPWCRFAVRKCTQATVELQELWAVWRALKGPISLVVLTLFGT